MNGSNLVTEADKKPFALCPICLRKLDSYCEISINDFNGLQKRYGNLASEIKESNNQRFSREFNLFETLRDQIEHEMDPTAKNIDESNDQNGK